MLVSKAARVLGNALEVLLDTLTPGDLGYLNTLPQITDLFFPRSFSSVFRVCRISHQRRHIRQSWQYWLKEQEGPSVSGCFDTSDKRQN